MSTTDHIVDGPPQHPGGLRRAHRWWIAGGVAGFVLSALVAVALLVELPYYAIQPGQAWATEPLVNIDGTEIYDSEGEIHFTTVSLRRTTPFEAFLGWLDDDVEVVEEEQILGDQTAEENRQLNQIRMDTSKLVAAKVALEKLGYTVPVTVTGETVVKVEPGTPADGTLEVGDTIVAVDGVELTEAGRLTSVLADARPGDTVVLTVDPPNRDENEQVEIVLAERPDGPDQGFIGVSLQARDLDFQLPFDVGIDTRDIGGPSAGLAFTLSILDLLTPGDLTGGERIAVTGTISADGAIGPVGGVAQKAATVRKAGIGLFLVPPGELEEARAHAGSSLRVVEVSTLDEALAALEEYGGNALDLGTPGATEEASAGN